MVRAMLAIVPYAPSYEYAFQSSSECRAMASITLTLVSYILSLCENEKAICPTFILTVRIAQYEEFYAIEEGSNMSEQYHEEFQPSSFYGYKDVRGYNEFFAYASDGQKLSVRKSPRLWQRMSLAFFRLCCGYVFYFAFYWHGIIHGLMIWVTLGLSF
jgi:hypothetical protein